MLGLITLPLYYSSQDIVLDSDGTATMIKKTWWGFKKREIHLKPMHNQWYYWDEKTKDWSELYIDDGMMEEPIYDKQKF